MQLTSKKYIFSKYIKKSECTHIFQLCEKKNIEKNIYIYVSKNIYICIYKGVYPHENSGVDSRQD